MEIIQGDKMKIAIIGGTGLVGSNLQKIYSMYDVRSFSRSNGINIDNSKNNIINFDFLEEELNNYFKKWKPDIIINAIGLINLQTCEKYLHLAKIANTIIPTLLARISIAWDIYFIHISTDHFFNDGKEKHAEFDNVILLNNYAKTKYEAECNILQIGQKALIVRTNVIGFRNNNIDSFFEWLLKSFNKEEEISLFSNFYTSPICINQFGTILIQCYQNKLNGIFNISNSETISKYDFGIKVAKQFGFETKYISQVQIGNNFNFKRALTLGLNVDKIENRLKIKMPNIDETIEQLYKENLENTCE